MEEKSRDSLRREMLIRRDQLSVEERQEKSAHLIERLFRLPLFAGARNVFTYVNFRSEVDTMPLVQQCIKNGVVVSVPITIKAESRLVACRLTDPERELRPGYCGIPEPELVSDFIINPCDIEVVILPGSVFDEGGGRLGYGGGFYDRFLANEAPQALRIGLAYELQIVPSLPLMSHDKRLHFLLTEERTLECR